MSAIAPAVAILAARIAELSAGLGARVAIDVARVADRSDDIALGPPGVWSPNRACRVVEAADGWLAVNLAREEDRELIPAWLGAEIDGPAWEAICAAARVRPRAGLVEDGRRLGLPVAAVGEVQAATLEPPRAALGRSGLRRDRLRVIDLSSLWAGPLCGSVLAALGAEVLKVESLGRPDPGRTATPGLYGRLNGGKAELALDFRVPEGRARLRDLMLAADLVITGARPRAFDQLGLSPAQVCAENPGLIWVAITGYGWTGEGADRVAFGDDAAAAGGLVGWTAAGAPRFLGDALADPVTGLAAAVGALQAIEAGGGVLVDAALARAAAGAAALLGRSLAA